MICVIQLKLSSNSSRSNTREGYSSINITQSSGTSENWKQKCLPCKQALVSTDISELQLILSTSTWLCYPKTRLLSHTAIDRCHQQGEWRIKTETADENNSQSSELSSACAGTTEYHLVTLEGEAI